MSVFDRPLWYLLDSNGNPYPGTEDDIRAMGELLTDIEKRRVALDEWQIGEATIRLSTVFLVTDHNFVGGGTPILYETMLFGVNGDDPFMDRYHTKEEAAAGHSAVKHIVQPFIDAQDLAGLQAVDWSEYEPPAIVDAATVKLLT